jgi:mono/diheme cytochrome c family protein
MTHAPRPSAASPRRASPRRRLRALLAVSLAAGALVAAGCGGESAGLQGANPTVGKGLFVERCGSCHTLQDAATVSQVGPSLDEAYARSREEGFDESTLFRVTLDQIDLAAPPMPPDIVEGQDAVDVAAYVAGTAGLPPQQQQQQTTGTTETTGETTTTP